MFGAALMILLGLVLAGQGALFLVARWLRSYASEKGKSLATKEDIGGITREVEKVRAEYKEQLEALAQRNREQLEGLAQQNCLLLESVRQRHELRLIKRGQELRRTRKFPLTGVNTHVNHNLLHGYA